MAWIGRWLRAALWLVAPAAPLLAHAAAGPMPGDAASPEVRQLASAVLATADHDGRPFAIVDKRLARLHVFDRDGRPRGATPVLLGATRGDRSAPGVGERTQVGRVRDDERTTPAGRFVSEPGRNTRGEAVVWVDYEAAFAIHRLRAGASRGDRAARLASNTPDDNRVSLGCIVVPERFYVDVVHKLFGHGRAVVYVMPEHGSARGLLTRRAAAELL
jgi:hypothetical protein